MCYNLFNSNKISWLDVKNVREIRGFKSIQVYLIISTLNVWSDKLYYFDYSQLKSL